MVENKTAAVGSIPAGGTRVVVGNSEGVVGAVESVLGTGEAVEAGTRLEESSASVIGTGNVLGVVLASGTAVVVVDRLDTSVAVAGVVVDEIART